LGELGEDGILAAGSASVDTLRRSLPCLGNARPVPESTSVGLAALPNAVRIGGGESVTGSAKNGRLGSDKTSISLLNWRSIAGELGLGETARASRWSEVCDAFRSIPRGTSSSESLESDSSSSWAGRAECAAGFDGLGDGLA